MFDYSIFDDYQISCSSDDERQKVVKILRNTGAKTSDDISSEGQGSFDKYPNVWTQRMYKGVNGFWCASRADKYEKTIVASEFINANQGENPARSVATDAQ